MKIIITLIALSITILSMSDLKAQTVSVSAYKNISDSDNKIINQHIKKYNRFMVKKNALIDSLYRYGKSTFRLDIDAENDWIITIQRNDMRSHDYTSYYTSDSGTFPDKEFYTPNTYKGKTSNGDIVRLTIDKDNFFGVILKDEEQKVIRQARDFTGNKKDESLVIYDNSDYIVSKNKSDYINDALVVPDAGIANLQNSLMSSELLCTYYLQIATEADYEFYQNYGSIQGANETILSALNLVEGVYESTFNLNFIVPFQNVWTTSSDPYSSTDASTLLDQFRSEWNANRTTVTRNIAHLFTGRNLDNDKAGVAWTGNINNDYSYSLSMDYWNMYATLAHEIGHNLNASHPGASDCKCGTSTASVMCEGQKDNNLWFCSQSINSINNFLVNHSSYLTGNIPDNLTLTGSVTGFNEHRAKIQITSAQVINSGSTIYKSPTIILSSDFEVTSGGVFSAEPLTDCNN
ncbi:MAG: zinc-dependent metalloprotease [Bacteroidales bacterium]|jgi:hypothetical protein|nr:zinc-dependent metalloprotease [Bacteroidales bacterium]